MLLLVETISEIPSIKSLNQSVESMKNKYLAKAQHNCENFVYPGSLIAVYLFLAFSSDQYFLSNRLYILFLADMNLVA